MHPFVSRNMVGPVWSGLLYRLRQDVLRAPTVRVEILQLYKGRWDPYSAFSTRFCTKPLPSSVALRKIFLYAPNQH